MSDATEAADEWLRAEARRLGVSVREVRDLARELRRQAIEARQWTEDLRRNAWEIYLRSVRRCVAGSAAFWRVGWRHVRQRVERDGRDFTSVPCYDLIGRELREATPEVRGWSTEQIFELLWDDYVPRPAADAFLGTAFDQIERAVCDPRNANESTTNEGF
ncbi:hypothetical protein Pla175_17570 [Pirellulimonas nuda]|uniref:Uncharacterized protein n=1 Tax=Pirellulimonas nuda TaxID=2528009 RepID=A0A518DA74_9BACT|nr:hypothetical protein Pla175_17570 [Pirellulimonas nuda]